MISAPSTAKPVAAATEKSYVCPVCGFTAGVHLPTINSASREGGRACGSAVVWVVRCVSCGRTSPFVNRDDRKSSPDSFSRASS